MKWNRWITITMVSVTIPKGTVATRLQLLSVFLTLLSTLNLSSPEELLFFPQLLFCIMTLTFWPCTLLSILVLSSFLGLLSLFPLYPLSSLPFISPVSSHDSVQSRPFQISQAALSLISTIKTFSSTISRNIMFSVSSPTS